jgi:hypothetical protein
MQWNNSLAGFSRQKENRGRRMGENFLQKRPQLMPCIFDQPIMILADLHADNRINFIDFAILADNWFENQSWP